MLLLSYSAAEGQGAVDIMGTTEAVLNELIGTEGILAR